MKKILAVLLALAMVFCFAACGPKDKVDPNKKDEGVMTHEQFVTAEEGTDVVIEGFITAKMYAKAYGNVSFYIQDGDGAYYVYRMPATDEDDAKLVVGQKVKVTGVKTTWEGESEIKEGTATYEVVKGKYEFDNLDVTDKLAAEDLIKYQNMKVEVKDAVVKTAPMYKYDGSGQQGDDIYVTFTIKDADYTFLVESDLCGADSKTYKTVEALKLGDKISFSGYLYWYKGVQMWIAEVK